MSSPAPQGFRRTVVLRRSLPGRSSRDPGLTNCPPTRGNFSLSQYQGHISPRQGSSSSRPR